MKLRTTVLIPSYQRPQMLRQCLLCLEAQTVLPSEVIVVWQGEDRDTKTIAEQLRKRLPYPLRVLHLDEPGIVPAENLALDAAQGEIIFMTDDDARPPPDWIERHLALYRDETVGAVGGPVRNCDADGTAWPRQEGIPLATVTWLGHVKGSVTQVSDDRSASPAEEIDHLMGPNMSLRRSAFDRFESELKPYWYLFEADACLQAKSNGFKTMFDYGCRVDHFPRGNPNYRNDRCSNPVVRIFHPAYNDSFVMARYGSRFAHFLGLLHSLFFGKRTLPGLLACPAAILRYGQPLRELRFLAGTWRYRVAGWWAGSRRRRQMRRRGRKYRLARQT